MRGGVDGRKDEKFFHTLVQIFQMAATAKAESS